MNNEIEVWKDVDGYQGLYQVSNFGRVKSLNYNKTGKEKILKHDLVVIHHKNRDYIQHQIILHKNGKRKHFLIHRLVYQTFIGEIPNGYQIDHRDNNPQNNKLENLQLLTRSENIKKCFIDNPNLISNLEKLNPKKKIICLNNNTIYESINECARKLNLYHQNIHKVLKGKINHTGGYRFKYVN